MKPCPHCGKEIQDEAIKCRWCLTFVSGNPAAEQNMQIQGGATEIAKPWIVRNYKAVVLVFFMVAVPCAMFYVSKLNPTLQKEEIAKVLPSAMCAKLIECSPEFAPPKKDCEKALSNEILEGKSGSTSASITKVQLEGCVAGIGKWTCKQMETGPSLPAGCEFWAKESASTSVKTPQDARTANTKEQLANLNVPVGKLLDLKCNALQSASNTNVLPGWAFEEVDSDHREDKGIYWSKGKEITLYTQPDVTSNSVRWNKESGARIHYDAAIFRVIKPISAIVKESRSITGDGFGAVKSIQAPEVYGDRNDKIVRLINGQTFEYLGYLGEGYCYLRVNNQIILTQDELCGGGGSCYLKVNNQVVFTQNREPCDQGTPEHVVDEEWIHIVESSGKSPGWLCVDSNDVITTGTDFFDD